LIQKRFKEKKGRNARMSMEIGSRTKERKCPAESKVLELNIEPR